MNLAEKCSLDLKDLLDKRTLVQNGINNFIKFKVLSGECDDTFKRIQDRHPMIPFILLAGLETFDVIVKEAYEDSEIFLHEDELKKALTTVFDADRSDLVYNYLMEGHLDVVPYELVEITYLHIPYDNNTKTYCIEMMDEGLEVEEYYASYAHYFKDEYSEYLYDYWIAYLIKNKEELWGEIQKKFQELNTFADDEVIF